MSSRHDKDHPVYMISVAARLAGVHPQTLRIYERKRLLKPGRTPKSTRLYSERDIEQLRLIQHLTQDEGINLAGVKMIMTLQAQADEVQELVRHMQNQLEKAHSRMEDIERAGRPRHEIVLVRRSVPARRER